MLYLIFTIITIFLHMFIYFHLKQFIYKLNHIIIESYFIIIYLNYIFIIQLKFLTFRYILYFIHILFVFIIINQLYPKFNIKIIFKEKFKILIIFISNSIYLCF